MSHLTRVENILVTDLDALEAACKAIGLELRRGQKVHAWWGRYVGDSELDPTIDRATLGQCEHAIGVRGVRAQSGAAGNWEIGVVRDGAGYRLQYDSYGESGRRLEQYAGRGLNRLRQYYAAETTTRTLSKSYHVTRTITDQGRIKLHVTEKR